jgi:hypothetical protein
MAGWHIDGFRAATKLVPRTEGTQADGIHREATGCTEGRGAVKGGGTFARLMDKLRGEQRVEAPRRGPARRRGLHKATCWSTALTR